MPDLAEVRSWYAEELQCVAALKSQRLVKAFATVARETFLGPGPWELRSPYGKMEYWKSKDANPARVYHNVLVAIDAERYLNNGLPSLWAYLFDNVAVSEGESVVHIGAGTGYYSAILAEIVGRRGFVTCIEIDADLAEQAKSNLSDYENVSVLCGNGSTFEFESADVIAVSAGATHPLRHWVERLNERGRLLVPITGTSGNGAALRVTRDDRRYSATFVSPVGFIPCIGARDEDTAKRLDSVYEPGYAAAARSVKSLRFDDHLPGEDCWLHRPGFCLSTADLAR